MVPQIANLQAMQAKGAGELKYQWTASGLAVIKEIAPGKLILKRAQNSGKLTVTATVNNGGTPTTQTLEIVVKEPGKDAWVQRTPDKDEKPEDNQFYARDDKNEGTLYYNGTLSDAADSVFLKVYADDKVIKTESQKLTTDKTYAFTVKLKPGLIKYKVEFGTEERRHRDGAAYGRQPGVRRRLPDRRPIQRGGDGLGSGRVRLTPASGSAASVPWAGMSARGGATRSAAKAAHGRSATGAWTLPSAWWRARRFRSASSTARSAERGSTSISGIPAESDRSDDDLRAAAGRVRTGQADPRHPRRPVAPGRERPGRRRPRRRLRLGDVPAVLRGHVGGLEAGLCPISSTTTSSRSGPMPAAMGGTGTATSCGRCRRTLPRLYSNMSVMSTLGIKPPGACHYPPPATRKWPG